jgi:hypothetical protein
MTIIEQSNIPKNKISEDLVFINEHYIAVIDGVTSSSGKIYENHTPGRMATILLEKKLSVLPHDYSGEQIMFHLNNFIKQYYYENNLIPETNKRIQAVIAIYSKYRNQIFRLGDINVLANNKLYKPHTHFSDLLAEVRSLYIELSIKDNSYEDDIGRELILPILKKQSLLANNTNSKYGYGVLDGLSFDKSFIETIDIIDNEIVLASDGYPILENTLKKSENRLKDILKKDPLLYQDFKSTKGLQGISFDDKSYIRFLI